MKLSLLSTSTTTATSTSSSGVILPSSARSVNNRRGNEDDSKDLFQSDFDRVAPAPAIAASTPNSSAPSLPKLERLPDYFRDTMDWLIGRSRRKGGGGGAGAATAAATATTGQGGCEAGAPVLYSADKENLEYRTNVDSKKPARDGAGGSSCSSEGSGGGDGSINRRYLKQQIKAAGHRGDGTAIRESRSADLASVSSASGAGTLGVCDTITEKDFEELVKLPTGMDPQEWMASHALDLFHHVNALYGAVCEFCTKESCPVMCGPGNVQFLWVDDKNRKVKYPAPQYVDCVMSFAERTVRSEEMFPTKFGNEFPANFESTLKKLCRLLYHVLAHLHVYHWEQMRALGIGSQAIAVHWHLAIFARHFQMLESKDAAGLFEITSTLRHMNVVDETVLASAVTTTSSADGGFNDQVREPMDSGGGCCEPPPRLQEANAQLQQ